MSSPRLLLTASLIGSLVLAALAHGQQPQLLKDINTMPQPGLSSDPSAPVALVGRAVFAANIGRGAGFELFTSNGTAATTRPIEAGIPRYYNPWQLTSLGSRIVYSANDGTAYRLMVTDGTAVGTTPLAPTSRISAPRGLVHLGNQVVFAADTGATGTEPCVSDGTAAGSMLLKDIVVGAGSSSPYGFLVVGNRAYFFANQIAGQVDLWRTDGTAAGTTLVASVRSTLIQSYYLSMAAIGNRVVLGVGGEIFISDGTASGTRKLGLGSLVGTTAQAIYYSVPANRYVTQLWKTDTSGNPGVMISTVMGPSRPYIGRASVSGSLLLFPVSILQSRVLYRTDGTTAGTYALAPTVKLRSGLTWFGGRAWFAGETNPLGSEIWSTDGTVAGTRPFGAIGPKNVDGFTVLGNRLWFAADSSFGREPWLTDGTVAGTRLVADIHARPKPATLGSMSTYADQRPFADAYGNTFFLSATPPGLWRTDGTATGTSLVVPGLVGQRLLTAAGRLFIAHDDKLELSVSDGTAAGTRRLATLGRTLLLKPAAPQVFELDGRLLFSGRSPGELWRTDGTTAGTALVKNLGTGRNYQGGFVPVHGGAVFFATNGRIFPNPNYRSEMWRTDGTATGTVQIGANFGGGILVADPIPFGRGRFMFATYTTSSRRELWSSDGTAAGTRQIKSFVGTAPPFGPQISLPGGNSQGVFVLIRDVFNLSELWFSDGTATGTVRIQHSPRGGYFDASRTPTMLGDRLAYPFATQPVGDELFISDGTAAGTRLVADLVPGPGSSRPRNLVRAGSRFVYFAAGPPDDPRLWRTDGTANGTVQLPGDTVPFGRMTVSGGKLYLTSDDPQFGKEPFVATIGATTIAVGRGCGERQGAALEAADPVLGSISQLELRDALPSRPGLVLIGAKAPDLSRIARLAGGCLVLLDLGLPAFSFPVRTDAQGSATIGLSIPNNSALIGGDVMAQAAVGPSRAALGIDLSAGLHLVLGR